jgi:hypothetical protein
MLENVKARERMNRPVSKREYVERGSKPSVVGNSNDEWPDIKKRDARDGRQEANKIDLRADIYVRTNVSLDYIAECPNGLIEVMRVNTRRRGAII